MKSSRFGIYVDGQFTWQIFLDRFYTTGLRSNLRYDWNVGPNTFSEAKLPGTVLFHQRNRCGVSALTEEFVLGFANDALAFLSYSNQQVRTTVAAKTDKYADQVLNLLQRALPEGAPVDPGTTRVVFWATSLEGPRAITRDLEVPPWATVQGNYANVTQATLKTIFEPGWRPSSGGRLLLWHGAPGTGKTYALRAVMSTWRDWCSFHVVLDPERFFGAGADYMLSVLLGGEDMDMGSSHGMGSYQPEMDPTEPEKPHWRLLIMEDTGELLSTDAKDRSGQGLSRLLNLSDGLLGQGLKVLTLITTNDDLGKMHEAVIRPGRCLSKVEFARFEPAEAEAWLSAHAITGSLRGQQCTLADLYARVEAGRPIGFSGDIGF